MRSPYQLAAAPDGARLAMTTRGDRGADALVLIPGLGAAASVFEPILQPLERRYRLVLYDPRGVGDSESGEIALSMEVLAGDVLTVLDGAGVQRAHVFGASMGGVVAQHLVVSRPERVRRLVLAATAPGGRKTVPADPRATDALLGRGARTPEEAYRRACTVLYSPQFQRTHAGFIEAQVRQRAQHPVRPRVFMAQLAALAQARDVVDELQQVTAPTLVAHGTADAVTPVKNAQILAGHIPGARTRWFDGCGHLFFHERPEESCRVLHEFLRDA